MYLHQQYFLISGTMAGLARAMSLLSDTFDKHAGKDGDCKTLSKAEVAQLIRSEFPEIVSRTDGHPSLNRAENASLSYF